MKRLQFAMLAVGIAATLVGCGNSAPKADLRSDIDSLSYLAGISSSRGVKDYLVMTLQVDTAYMDEVFKGIKDGVNGAENKKRNAYMAGLQIGMQIKNNIMPRVNMQYLSDDTTLSISQRNFLAGFIGATQGKEGVIDPLLAGQLQGAKGEQIRSQIAERVYGPNKKAGEKFLADNAKKEGVVTLPSGVQYKILKEGKGALPTDTSIVKVNYEGRLINDSVFDSSYRRNTPSQFRLRGVIPGWQEALKLMPVGSEWEIYIPQEQAYGARKQTLIDPFSALVFKVELVDIVNNNNK